MQTRYYDPETARFINADTISILDESQDLINGLNLYAYCGNNPVMRIDPNGMFFISFLIGLGIAAAIGAGVGATAYTATKVITYATTGNWSWSWGEFAGAVVGGAIGGALAFAIPGLGIAGSAFVTGALSEGLGMVFQNAWEGTNYGFWDIIKSSAISGGLAALTAGATSKLKITGFTGRGSISQVARQISTKFYSGTIRHITAKTFGKMVAYEAAYSFFNLVADSIIDTYNYYKRPGVSWGYSYN